MIRQRKMERYKEQLGKKTYLVKERFIQYIDIAQGIFEANIYNFEETTYETIIEEIPFEDAIKLLNFNNK